MSQRKTPPRPPLRPPGGAKPVRVRNQAALAPRPIRLLLVDDHPVVREGLRSCLAAHPQLQIIGEATSGEAALRQAVRLQPDLVLMDINLPGITGLEATARLRQFAPAAKVLILTMHDRREYAAQATQCGARGYVLKDASPAELVQAIEAVHRGETFFSQGIAATMLNGLSRADPEPLSDRERAVLVAIAEGASSKEIGQRLTLSPNTVRTYRTRLRRKLDLHTVAAFTEYAVVNGLIRPAAAANSPSLRG